MTTCIRHRKTVPELASLIWPLSAIADIAWRDSLSALLCGRINQLPHRCPGRNSFTSRKEAIPCIRRRDAVPRHSTCLILRYVPDLASSRSTVALALHCYFKTECLHRPQQSYLRLEYFPGIPTYLLSQYFRNRGAAGDAMAPPQIFLREKLISRE